MMQLPALTPEERAYLQSAGQSNPVLPALAARLRQRLIASLGMAVSVCESAVSPAHTVVNGREPMIEIEPALAAAWLAVRLGGAAEAKTWAVRDAALIEPLKKLARHALAETVINLGGAAWPQSMRLQVDIGAQQGRVDIYWSGENSTAWAHRAIREKP